MGEVLKPGDAEEVREAIRWAAGNETPIEVRGAGSKAGLGRPPVAEHVLDLSALAGLDFYEPEELVLRAGPATPMDEIEGLLSQNGQQLAFEPADLCGLLGAEARPTLGGVLATNHSGPRRFKAGAARDHFLGFQAVTGRGDIVRSGGRVMKNVTGYDLSKLLAGSHGTLAAMTEVTVKVAPAPRMLRTVLVQGMADAAAVALLAELGGSPHEVSGLAHLPAEVAARSGVGYVAGAGGAITAARVEGPEPSVLHRTEALHAAMGRHGATEELHGNNSRRFWREVADVSELIDPALATVWKLSLTPGAAPGVVRALLAEAVGEAYYDWAGGLVWLALPSSEDAAHVAVRAAVGAEGHATLIRAEAPVRARVPVFHPQPEPLARLSARIKQSFDPACVLNRGRMYEEA